MKYEFDSETKKWLEETYSKILAKMDAECLRIGDKIPYISENGKYVHDMAEKDIYWWTNGFWAGMLWQMYHATGDEKYKNTARAVGKSLTRPWKATLSCITTWDLCGFIQALRITVLPAAKKQGQTGFMRQTSLPEDTIRMGNSSAHGTATAQDG